MSVIVPFFVSFPGCCVVFLFLLRLLYLFSLLFHSLPSQLVEVAMHCAAYPDIDIASITYQFWQLLCSDLGNLNEPTRSERVCFCCCWWGCYCSCYGFSVVIVVDVALYPVIVWCYFLFNVFRRVCYLQSCFALACKPCSYATFSLL